MRMTATRTEEIRSCWKGYCQQNSGCFLRLRIAPLVAGKSLIFDGDAFLQISRQHSVFALKSMLDLEWVYCYQDKVRRGGRG